MYWHRISNDVDFIFIVNTSIPHKTFGIFVFRVVFVCDRPPNKIKWQNGTIWWGIQSLSIYPISNIHYPCDDWIYRYQAHDFPKVQNRIMKIDKTLANGSRIKENSADIGSISIKSHFYFNSDFVVKCNKAKNISAFDWWWQTNRTIDSNEFSIRHMWPRVYSCRYISVKYIQDHHLAEQIGRITHTHDLITIFHFIRHSNKIDIMLFVNFVKNNVIRTRQRTILIKQLPIVSLLRTQTATDRMWLVTYTKRFIQQSRV